MRGCDPALPIYEVLEPLVKAVRARGLAVLQAPPGAGKTTQVPLALLETVTTGKILMLEPRRVAARAAAERLAALLGEDVGQTIGYRMRGESVAGARVEVITEGILTRMLQTDPELSGVGCVIFDEFHERALQADLGLALCLEVRGALREDLSLVVMSATLDAGPVAKLVGDAPVLTSQGRAFEVAVRHIAKGLGPGGGTGRDFLRAAADLVRQALQEVAEGDVLVFLPGQREIRMVEGLLSAVPAEITPLYGAMPFAAQRRALSPAAGGTRKIVLATSIAETSARLVTERVTRAEAEQRRGRAGRVAAGVCYRLWTKGEDGALAAFPPAEIEVADLVPLALELTAWGAEPGDLPFLTPPNAGAYRAAQQLLMQLGGLDARGGLTEQGRAMARLPVHPRLARMLLAGGAKAAEIAALLQARDPLRAERRVPVDLALRVKALCDRQGFERVPPFRADPGVLSDIRAEAKRLSRRAGKGADLSLGQMLALAYPDRVALRRPGDQPRYLLSGGSGAVLEADDPLAGQRLLVAADLDGDKQEARVRRAAILTEAELRAVFGPQIKEAPHCRWNRRTGEVEARIEERFGALVLASRAWSDAPSDVIGAALLEGLRDRGLDRLNWGKPATALRGRVAWVNRGGAGLRDVSDQALLDQLEDWLLPWMADVRSFSSLRALDLAEPLRLWIGAEGLAGWRSLTASHPRISPPPPVPGCGSTTARTCPRPRYACRSSLASPSTRWWGRTGSPCC